MAVTAGMSGGSLVINADPLGGTVDVRAISNTVQVKGPGAVLNFNASGIREIRFHGSARNDIFTNYTSLDATIYGNNGDDQLKGGSGIDRIYGGEGHDRIDGGIGPPTRYVGPPQGLIAGVGVRPGSVIVAPQNFLYGGNGNDTLIGGNGADAIYGEAGDDRLLGGEGADRLDGGAGNDGLYGGLGSDQLIGGADADRFLALEGKETIVDMNRAADALINFSNRNVPWTDQEIEQVDLAFEELQRAIGGSTWIFRDTFTDDPLFFTKVRPGDIGEYVGLNSIRWSPFDYDREIKIVDWDESSFSANHGARATVIHEMGHNWDGTSRPFAHEANPYWGAYVALHDASERFRGSPDFARNYGQENAHEDWATAWELYFGYASGPTRPSEVLRQKLALVDAFFSLPSDWLT